MSVAQSVFAIALAASVSLALSLLITSGRAQETATQPPVELGVEWAFRPASLGELVGDTKAAVVAEVEGVHAGAPIPIDGAAPVPTELVDVRVVRTIEGTTPARLTLYRLGGAGVHPEGSPPYSPGERYLLFVRRRLSDDLSQPNPDGTYIAVAPDGRLEVEANGRLDALIPGAVAQRLDGDSVDQASSEIDAAQGGGAGQ